ncbi:hypothetical protein HIR68_02600 [Staphylococcus coagulans]|uniref:fibrinogen-binding protein n=1 Tax=Staphylococcus coagulans TaxID=74706 RepID=UPI001BE8BE85|nr:fibrinogen-binding protein [Staphylococcus coagulans]MBT2830129.1 hypothetical protein [Staphylococcus coagulans]MBT2859271.1 hypothetical protein [Staphylococcus coagulans]MBU3873995.1 hypothetical protein [Staphylococcus coagulans]
MKNKLITKSLLAIATIGITATTFIGTADASVVKGTKEKTNITTKIDVNNKFNLTPKRQQQLEKAKQLVTEFEKTHTVQAHRKAQRAVNIVSFEYQSQKNELQQRIDKALKYKVK